MKHEDFLNKYIYDTTIEDLFWLKENSHINEEVFYGRYDYLANNLSQQEILNNIKVFNDLFSQETIDIITFYINLYYKNLSYNTVSLLYDKLRYFIEELKYIETAKKFFNNKKYLIAFSNLYQIFHHIEINVLPNSPLNNKKSYVRWELYHEPLIRKIDENLSNEFSLRYVIKHIEHGKYQQALDLFNSKEENKYFNLPNLISIMYYKLMLLKKMNLKNEINELINEFELTLDIRRYELDKYWNTTIQKVALFYIELYEFTRDEIYLEKSKYYFYKSFIAIANINSTATYHHTSRQQTESIMNSGLLKLENALGNIELIREYFLNILVYAYITGVKKIEFN